MEQKLPMRYDGIDLLRGMAAFGIVGCHLSLSDRTDAGLLLTALCDFNVGLFAAIAGFLMVDVRGPDELWGYAKKRMGRLLPSYIAWSIVFLLMTIVFDLVFDGGQVNPRYYTVQFWVNSIFWGGGGLHLWFLPCLFYSQVVTAVVFAVFTKNRHGILWVLLGGVIVYASVNLGNWYGTYLVRLLAFLVTGHGLKLLVRSRLEYLRRYSLLLLVFAVSVLVFHVCMRGIIHGFYRDWIAVGPVLIVFTTLDFRSEKIKRFVGLFGAASMGVYLIHPLITRAISVVVTRCVNPPYSAFVVLAEWSLAWLLAFTAALVIHRIPIAKRLI